MEEYIITLKLRQDLESFYDDMETEGGALHIPDRLVDCSLKRPTSRNTVYLLSEEEAMALREDERVSHVALNIPLTPVLHSYTRTGRYDKNINSPPSYSNSTSWSLLRTRLLYNDDAAAINNWYAQYPNSGTGTQLYIDDSITATESGEHVDIVIVDYASVIPNHPEFAVNLDGTGGSRVQEIDWNIYTTIVQGDNPGLNVSTNYLQQSYSYTPYSTGNSSEDKQINHGCSSASLAAGNTNGAAFKANIYSISTFDGWLQSNNNIAANGTLYLTMWDYIRAFHNNKAINPTTGRKNPTIVSGSYGYIYEMSQVGTRWPHYARSPDLDWGNINNSAYRLTAAQMEAAEICAEANISGTSGSHTATIAYTPLDIIADVEDAIADGIHIVSSAGNSNQVMEPYGTSLHNGTWFRSQAISQYKYKARNWTPNEGIFVGALSGTREGFDSGPTGKGEMPDYYTCRGNGVDIYAPASGCVAAVNSSTGNERQDPRNSSFYFGTFGGTSAAAPNVTGILACVLERFPDYTPATLKEYMFSNMSRDRDTHNEIGDDGKPWPGTQVPAGSFDNFSFHPDEDPKTIMYLKDIRPTEGRCETKEIYGPRKTSGRVFPRSKVCRTNR